MALYGSSVPIEGLPNGAMAVLVICPNAYSHQRLMQSLQSIVPDAGEAAPGSLDALRIERSATDVPQVTHYRDPEQDDDEGLPADFTQCRIGGGGE